MSESRSVRPEVREAGQLAYLIAEWAVEAVGPNGTVMQVHEDDASLIRATFIARLAETATMIANGEIPNE